MATESFQKTNLDWQLRQVSQRISEWLEFYFSRPQDNQPPPQEPFTLPEWVLDSLFWIIVAGLITWLLWQVLRLLSPYRNWFTQSLNRSTSASSPSAKPQTAVAWVQQAQVYRRQGDYGKACRALYMAMLQRLDETKQIPDDQSRTDGEYLNIVQTFDQPHPYRTLITTHERIQFGQQPGSADAFERCQQAYRDIEKQTSGTEKRG